MTLARTESDSLGPIDMPIVRVLVVQDAAQPVSFTMGEQR